MYQDWSVESGLQNPEMIPGFEVLPCLLLSSDDITCRNSICGGRVGVCSKSGTEFSNAIYLQSHPNIPSSAAWTVIPSIDRRRPITAGTRCLPTQCQRMYNGSTLFLRRADKTQSTHAQASLGAPGGGAHRSKRPRGLRRRSNAPRRPSFWSSP